MGKKAERELKALCLIFCFLIFILLTGADVPEKSKAEYRFISASEMHTLTEDSKWKTDEEWNGRLRKSLARNGDREARWVYIFRQ